MTTITTTSDTTKVDSPTNSQAKPMAWFAWSSIAIVLIVMAAILRLQGRIWWCKLDSPLHLATPHAWNDHTSQHFFDPYSITHVLHGFLFYWLLAAAIPRSWFGPHRVMWLLSVAVAIEAGWELLENSNMIIERYRQNTASLDYFGDSIANSIGDMISCMIGFGIVRRIGWRWGLGLFVLMELLLLIWIRDNLTINVLMLTYPIEAVKAWQTKSLPPF